MTLPIWPGVVAIDYQGDQRKKRPATCFERFRVGIVLNHFGRNAKTIIKKFVAFGRWWHWRVQLAEWMRVGFDESNLVPNLPHSFAQNGLCRGVYPLQ